LEEPEMSIDPEMARKLADLKKQLEDIAGKEIDASPLALVVAGTLGSPFFVFAYTVLTLAVRLVSAICSSAVTA
jgi:hypothetical protein